MERNGKGTSVSHYINDYIVLDLETTHRFPNIAKIIEISALKVRNNIVIDEYQTLVNPDCKIPSKATAINHITNEMVKDAPKIDEVIDSFLDFVGDDIILGYNNSSFDNNVIYDIAYRLRGHIFSNNYIDLMHASKRVMEDVENFKLETISNYFGLDTSGEHRALKDCYLTKECYELMYKKYGDAIFFGSMHYSAKKATKSSSRQIPINYSKESIALDELQSLLNDITTDGEITQDEFDTLSCWIEDHNSLQGNYPFDRVFNAIDNVLYDGIATPEELKELQILFTSYNDPVANMCSTTPIRTLKEKHVCITGDFDFGDRKTVQNLIIDAGGIIDDNVKKSTTSYLVVGAKGSENWITGNYGTKVKKALEFNAKGKNIKLYQENIFIPMIQELINNPSEVSLFDFNYEEEEESEPNQLEVKYSFGDDLEETLKKDLLPNSNIILIAVSTSNYYEKVKDNPEYCVEKVIKGKSTLVVKSEYDRLDLLVHIVSKTGVHNYTLDSVSHDSTKFLMQKYNSLLATIKNDTFISPDIDGVDETVCIQERLPVENTLETNVHDSSNYKNALKSTIEEIISEQNLPINSIRFSQGKGKDGLIPNHYLIQIFEPEYPLTSKKTEVVSPVLILDDNIDGRKAGTVDIIAKNWLLEAVGIPSTRVNILSASDDESQKVRFLKQDKNLVPFVRKLIEEKVLLYQSKSSFSCCSRFSECSDAKKCIHENLLYSTGCQYRRNLENGKIFYGKNKNV